MASGLDVTIATRWTPPIVLAVDPVGAQSGRGAPSWLLSWLKPSVTAHTPLGSFGTAPWGEPGAPRPWALLFGLAAVAVLAAVGLFSLFRKR